jgi:hypothetical protein
MSARLLRKSTLPEPNRTLMMTTFQPVRGSRTILYLAFAGTGICMALPGSVMPAMLARLALADSQAGLLLFTAWIGTSLGALLVRGSIARSLATGCFILAAGSLGMAFAASGIVAASFAWMAIFGLGLGMTMTATSLLQAVRHPGTRAAELNRLNLVWSIGAFACPSLAEHSLRIASVRSLFAIVGALFVAICLWTLAFERDLPQPAGQRPSPSQTPTRWKLSLWPTSILVLICLPTAVEASMGGWIAAYIQRTHHVIGTTVTAGSCFWLGLLLSRAISTYALFRRRSENFELQRSLCLVVIGITLLIASDATLVTIPGIFLVGFGLGPIYPILLANALRYSENSTIFFIAGLGSAIFPWLTGVLSSYAHSLRVGLLIPFAVAILMLVLGIRLVLLRQSSVSSAESVASN